MFKIMFKLGIWLIVGVGSITTLLANSNFQTPWKYVIDSYVSPGTQITLTQPDGELTTMEVVEGQTGSKTFDVGAPITLAGVYLIGSIMTFGLKRRPRSFVSNTDYKKP